jgi:predicted CXXCH cytochrome family protein
MTRRIPILAALVPLLAVGMAFGQGIVGTAHDFSLTDWADGEICKPCHTPHHASSEISTRLWNHDLSEETYQIKTTTVAQNDMDVRSRMCLSCHDGTVALDAFGGREGSTMMGGTAVLGSDLRDDHPIGPPSRYQPSATTRYKPVSATSFGGGAWRQPEGANLRLYPRTGLSNPDDFYVTCTSCHDVHGQVNHGDRLLRMTMDASSLCLGCHVK